MQKFVRDSISRTKLAVAVVIASLLAAGGLLALRNAKAPLKEAAAGTNVRARARDLDASDNSQVAVPDSVRGTGVPPVDHAQDARATLALQGSVPRALNRSRKIYRQNSGTEPLTLTIVLKRADQRAFEKFVNGLQDPGSLSYQQYLSAGEQADRFGPSLQTYAEVSDWLARKGFTVVDDSQNRLTITVNGTRREAEKAFDVRLDDYREGDRTFYSNDGDPRLPANIAAHVQAVIGLNNVALPVHVGATEVVLPPQYDPKGNLARSCWYSAQLLEVGKPRPFLIGGLTGYFCMAEQLNMLNLLASSTPPPAADEEFLNKLSGVSPASGAGQKIGLLEFDNFVASDVRDFLNLIGRTNQFAQLSQVHVAGGFGAPGFQESEVLLDISAVMTLAPGAQVVVYDGPFNGRGSFQTMFNAMIGYLRRNPNDPQDSDHTGYDFWLTKLNQFNGNYINAEMVKAFLSSIEYRQRFGP